MSSIKYIPVKSREEFLMFLNRGMNTLEPQKQPQWLKELADSLVSPDFKRIEIWIE